MRPEEAFRKNLIRIIAEKDIAQSKLDVMAGLSSGVTNATVNGKCTPKLITAWKMAKALGVSLDNMMRGAEL